MDDLVALCEGIRTASASVLSAAEQAAANEALDEAIEVYRWSRRLAGDAQEERLPAVPLQGRLSVTIKWVKVIRSS